MAEFQSKFTGQEIENTIDKLRNWLAAGIDGTYPTVTISSVTYDVIWKVIPTPGAKCYGIGLDRSTGRPYEIYYDGSSYKATALDANTDTKNTAGSSNSDNKLFIVGAAEQSASGVQTYSNSNAYIKNGLLYSGGAAVLTAHAAEYGKIKVSGSEAKTADSAQDTIEFAAGGNLSVARAGDKITYSYSTPDALKNPNKLNLKVNSETSNFVEYDGSAAKTVTVKPSTTAGAFVISDGKTDKTIQLAGAFTDNDTKNTAGSSNSNSKLFIIGASTQAANPQTYSNSAVYTQNGKLYSNNTEVSVVGHTHSFDTITNRGEAFLSWGGKNFSGTYGPIDAAMVPELGANRLAFMPANAVTIEYSRDGGSTWTDYGPTDSQKVDLFNGRGASFTIGKATSGAGNIATNKYQLRVNIYTSAGKVYTVLNKFVIYLSTSGTNNNWCTIRARKQSDYTAGNDKWTTFADKISVSGWSGYNVINTSGITTYGNTASTQYGHIQFIFGCDTGSTNNSYAGLNISKIFGFGGVGWTTPSTMAKTGHMYTYDSSQNVTFPEGVSAKSFTEGGTTLANKYLGKTAKAADADKLDGNDSTYYLNYDNLTNKPTFGTAAGNIPVLDNSGKLAESVIPAVAITDTYVVATEAAMLALSAQKGDIAIRSDLNKSFVLQSTPASTLANWKELLTPTDAVLSINSKTGAVTLSLDDISDGSTRKLADYLPLSGGSVTGALSATQLSANIIETGTGDNNYFQSRKFRGEGNAATYYHAVDFGFAGHNQVDFYEYGGIWNFWKNTEAAATTAASNLCLQIGDTYVKNKGNTFTWPTTSGTVALKEDIPTEATAADNILHGSNNGMQITYDPYAAQQSKLSFDTSTTAPTRTDRLNLNGYLYATKFNVAGKAAVQYNSTEDCIEFIFA